MDLVHNIIAPQCPVNAGFNFVYIPGGSLKQGMAVPELHQFKLSLFRNPIAVQVVGVNIIIWIWCGMLPCPGSGKY
jgi:hypothetical protein